MLWKTTFVGRQPAEEDDLRLKTTFGGRRPSVEDDLQWKTNFGGQNFVLSSKLYELYFFYCMLSALWHFFIHKLIFSSHLFYSSGVPLHLSHTCLPLPGFSPYSVSDCKQWPGCQGARGQDLPYLTQHFTTEQELPFTFFTGFSVFFLVNGVWKAPL